MRVVDNVGYREWRDALSHDWTALLVRLGAEPILVPNLLPEPERFLASVNAAGLILIGGDDPDSETIGMAGTASRPQDDPRGLRDWTEARLLAHAQSNRLPVLGVCRGLETVNLFYGGKVHADIEGLTGERHVAVPHDIRLAADWLGRPSGTTVRVNSFHRQGVGLGDLAPSLVSLAATTGGVVEALAHRELPVAAVQWHPERPDSDIQFDQCVFRECLGLGS